MIKCRTNRIIAFLLFLLLAFSPTVFASDQAKEVVYVIPLKEEITKASERYIDISIKEAEKIGANKIIIDLDTYGGLVDSAEKIKNYLLETDIETTCFINSKAESAGVLIAISCDKIAMSKTGTIGSAETIPNTEKILSMWKSMLRNVAQIQGRDSKIVEAMADSSIVIDGLSEKGKLLNLTAKEALDYKISDKTVDNIDDVISFVSSGDVEVKTANEDWATKIAKIISQQWVSSLLLVLGFVGLIVEFFVPGFGLPGIIGGLSFFLFFGSNILVGNASWFSIMFFILGGILIIIEVFIPGFGLPGIAGTVLCVLGLITSMQTVQQAFTAILLALLVAVITITVIFKYGLNSRTFKNITLEKSIRGHSSEIPQTEDNLVVVGDRGITLTKMRPYGFVKIGGEKFDASAESNFINEGVEVEVIRIYGNKIIVKEI